MKYLFIILYSIFLIPASAVFAAPTDFNSLIKIFINIVTSLIPIAGGLAFLYFFWGVAKFIFAAGNEEKRKSSKTIMTWGLVALFVMLSIYGILKLFGTALFPNFSPYYKTPPQWPEQETRRWMEDGSYRQLLDPETLKPYPGIEGT
jgi:hypothetical protein